MKVRRNKLFLVLLLILSIMPLRLLLLLIYLLSLKILNFIILLTFLWNISGGLTIFKDMNNSSCKLPLSRSRLKEDKYKCKASPWSSLYDLLNESEVGSLKASARQKSLLKKTTGSIRKSYGLKGPALFCLFKSTRVPKYKRLRG